MNIKSWEETYEKREDNIRLEGEAYRKNVNRKSLSYISVQTKEVFEVNISSRNSRCNCDKHKNIYHYDKPYIEKHQVVHKGSIKTYHHSQKDLSS